MCFRGETDRAAKLYRKAIDRYRAKTKLLAPRDSQDEESEAATIIKAGTLTDSLNYDAIFDENNFAKWPDGYIASFRTACLIKKEVGLLMRAWRCLPCDSPHISKIELDVPITGNIVGFQTVNDCLLYKLEFCDNNANRGHMALKKT